MKPPRCTAASFRASTFPDEQVTPVQPHSSLSGAPDEHVHPDTLRELMPVELAMSHMLACWAVTMVGTGVEVMLERTHAFININMSKQMRGKIRHEG